MSKPPIDYAMINNDGLSQEFCDTLHLKTVFGDLVRCGVAANYLDVDFLSGSAIPISGIGSYTFTRNLSASVITDYQGAVTNIEQDEIAYDGQERVTGLPSDEYGSNNDTVRYDPTIGTNSNKGFSCWEQRTNKCISSDDMKGSAWQYQGTASGVLDGVSPVGNGYRIDDVGSASVPDRLRQVVTTFNVDTRYELAFYMKRNTVVGSSNLRVSNPFTSSKGRWVIDFSLISNTEYELITKDHPAVDAQVDFLSSGVNGGITFDDNFEGGVFSFFINGVDFQEGTFSTPHIKTTSVAVTRNADIMSYDSDNYSTVEGGVYVEWESDLDTAADRSLLSIQASDSTVNSIRCYITSTNTIKMIGVTSSVITINSFAVLQSSGINKLYLGWKDGGNILSVNGNTIPVPTNGAPFNAVDAVNIYVGSQNDGVQKEFYNGNIHGVEFQELISQVAANGLTA